MATRQRRTGAEKGKGGVEQKEGVDVKMVVQTIKEATGATEEDVKLMLEECNFDANETTSRLIDSEIIPPLRRPAEVLWARGNAS